MDPNRQNSLVAPASGSIGLQGQAVAMIHDGPDRGGISDFKGKSQWQAIDGGFEVWIEERLGNAKSREPAVLDVLAGKLGADVISRAPERPDAKDHGDRGEDGKLRLPDGNELLVQTVSITVDENYWKWANGPTRMTPRFVSFTEGAAWIAEAIKNKGDIGTEYRAKMILALDARHAGYVVDERFATVAVDLIPNMPSLGFAQVWAVGPIPTRCLRLHPR